MALFSATCPNCGGKVQLDDTKEKGICENCGTELIVKKELQKVQIEYSEDIKKQLTRIKDLVDTGGFSDAKSLITNVLTKDPTNGKAHLYAFMCDYCLRNLDSHQEFISPSFSQNDIGDTYSYDGNQYDIDFNSMPQNRNFLLAKKYLSSEEFQPLLQFVNNVLNIEKTKKSNEEDAKNQYSEILNFLKNNCDVELSNDEVEEIFSSKELSTTPQIRLGKEYDIQHSNLFDKKFLYFLYNCDEWGKNNVVKFENFMTKMSNFENKNLIPKLLIDFYNKINEKHDYYFQIANNITSNQWSKYKPIFDISPTLCHLAIIKFPCDDKINYNNFKRDEEYGSDCYELIDWIACCCHGNENLINEIMGLGINFLISQLYEICIKYPEDDWRDLLIRVLIYLFNHDWFELYYVYDPPYAILHGDSCFLEQYFSLSENQKSKLPSSFLNTIIWIQNFLKKPKNFDDSDSYCDCTYSEELSLKNAKKELFKWLNTPINTDKCNISVNTQNVAKKIGPPRPIPSQALKRMTANAEQQVPVANNNKYSNITNQFGISPQNNFSNNANATNQKDYYEIPQNYSTKLIEQAKIFYQQILNNNYQIGGLGLFQGNEKKRLKAENENLLQNIDNNKTNYVNYMLSTECKSIISELKDKTNELNNAPFTAFKRKKELKERIEILKGQLANYNQHFTQDFNNQIKK